MQRQAFELDDTKKASVGGDDLKQDGKVAKDYDIQAEAVKFVKGASKHKRSPK